MIEIEKKKMGRPKSSPYRESFRLSEEDMQKIKFCMNKTGMNKTDVIRKGIDLIYSELKK